MVDPASLLDRSNRRNGFTLVEVSIVLVVIGLISATILVGRDLIRAAELRKLHSQWESFAAAANVFKTKYNCLPGDCVDATDFFGANPNCPSLSSATPADPAVFINDLPGMPTCNGDGDGRLDANDTLYEMTTFWQQLSDAGLIPGSYTGGWPSQGGAAWVSGINTPPALSQTSHWMVMDRDHSVLTSFGIFATIIPGGLGTVFSASAGTANPQVKPLTPAEAADFDAKYDDGSPVGGQVMVASGLSHCTSAVDESRPNPANASAQYLAVDPLYKNEYNCALIFRAGF